MPAPHPGLHPHRAPGGDRHHRDPRGTPPPVLGKAKESARATVCAGNLRQMGLGATMYAHDYRGRLPSFRDWLCVKVGDLKTGELFPYVGVKGSYLCPTDFVELSSRRKIKGAPPVVNSHMAKHDFTFSMNCGLCHAEEMSTFIAPHQTMLVHGDRHGDQRLLR